MSCKDDCKNYEPTVGSIATEEAKKREEFNAHSKMFESQPCKCELDALAEKLERATEDRDMWKNSHDLTEKILYQEREKLDAAKKDADQNYRQKIMYYNERDEARAMLESAEKTIAGLRNCLATSISLAEHNKKVDALEKEMAELRSLPVVKTITKLTAERDLLKRKVDAAIGPRIYYQECHDYDKGYKKAMADVRRDVEATK